MWVAIQKKLNEFPQLQARLWDKLRGRNYEMLAAKVDCSLQDVVKCLYINSYYELLNKPMPFNQDAIVYDLSQDGLITAKDNGLYDITNLGALLLARQLSSFKHLDRKVIRIIRHKGDDRLEMLKEQVFDHGYAVSFKEAETYLTALLPTEERIEKDGVRKKDRHSHCWHYVKP